MLTHACAVASLPPPGQSFRDFCKCYKGFQGNDCSQRTCAFGLSFIDTPQGDLNHDNAMDGGYFNRLANTFERPAGTANLTALNPMWRPDGWWESHPSQLYGTNGQEADFPMRQSAQEGHFYAECSNRGLCDRSTGECVCFTGYEGTACNRTACPNSCSGHGVCNSIREMQPNSDSTVGDYMLWDADKTYGCTCDPEYFGNDCSKRRCYRNDDPLTSVSTTKWKSEKLSEQGEVQIVKIACANQGEVLSTSSFTLTYTDVQFGEQYTTAAHTLGSLSDADAAADVKSLLEALPNQVLESHADNTKITSVTRDTQTTALGGTIYRYYITFDSRLGNVPTLGLDTSNIACKAGIVLPANYKSDTWAENIGIELVDNGPSEDTTVQLRISQNSSLFHQFNYRIFSGDETEASADWSTDRTFPTYTSTAVPLDRTHENNLLSPLGDNLLKAKFIFPNGAEVKEGTQSTRTSVDVSAAHEATETYEIQFKAPAQDSSVFTQIYNISDTLPIAYALDSRPLNGEWEADTVRETLYVEYTSPFVTHWVSENFTITSTSRDSYTWAASWSGNSGNGTIPSNSDWSFLEGADDTDKYLVFRWEHGDSYASRANEENVWHVSAYPGYVSSSGGAADELLFLSWTDDTRPIEELNFVVSITNEGSANNASRYAYSVNGINMGEYAVSSSFNQLGGASGSEAGKIQVRWMHETFADDRHDQDFDKRTWRFNMVKNPIQNNWAYLETLRVHYRHATDGAQITPSTNLAIVINIVTVAGGTDTYRWKLADDEVWYGEGDGSGSDFSDDPFQLADASTHTNSAAALQQLVFWFGAGADATGLNNDPARSGCGGDTVNARYYVQIGSEGINDFGTCSDRGVCDEDTGECKCFKGYAGQDCSEQHALSL